MLSASDVFPTLPEGRRNTGPRRRRPGLRFRTARCSMTQALAASRPACRVSARHGCAPGRSAHRCAASTAGALATRSSRLFSWSRRMNRTTGGVFRSRWRRARTTGAVQRNRPAGAAGTRAEVTTCGPGADADRGPHHLPTDLRELPVEVRYTGFIGVVANHPPEGVRLETHISAGSGHAPTTLPQRMPAAAGRARTSRARPATQPAGPPARPDRPPKRLTPAIRPRRPIRAPGDPVTRVRGRGTDA